MNKLLKGLSFFLIMTLFQPPFYVLSFFEICLYWTGKCWIPAVKLAKTAPGLIAEQEKMRTVRLLQDDL